MEDYRSDNPFAPRRQSGTLGAAGQYRPDNPFAKSGQSATEPAPSTAPIRLAPVRVMAEPPTDTAIQRPARAPSESVATARPQFPAPRTIRATPEPGFLERVGEALTGRVREKFRAKSAAPDAPSALPRHEREAGRIVEQQRIYGERAGKTSEQIAADTQQALTDFQADESQWANRIGQMLGEFVDPSMLVIGAGAERLAMLGIEQAAAKGVPLAAKLVELVKVPEGASLVRRLIARATHGAATGGAANVAAQTVATVGEQHRLPTAREAAESFAVGTVAGPVLEAGASLVAAPFREALRPPPRRPAVSPESMEIPVSIRQAEPQPAETVRRGPPDVPDQHMEPQHPIDRQYFEAVDARTDITPLEKERLKREYMAGVQSREAVAPTGAGRETSSETANVPGTESPAPVGRSGGPGAGSTPVDIAAGPRGGTVQEGAGPAPDAPSAQPPEAAGPVVAPKGVRDAQGRLRRNLRDVPSNEIADELIALGNAIGEDANVGTTKRDDANHWSTMPGASKLFATDASMKASGRNKSRNQAMQRLAAELERRGEDPEAAMEAALERTTEREGFASETNRRRRDELGEEEVAPGVMFSPTRKRADVDLFDEPVRPAPTGPEQPSMFGDLEGTKLAQAEHMKAQRAAGAIKADEMARRREELGAAPSGAEQSARAADDQINLLSPDLPATYRAKLAETGTPAPSAAEHGEVRTLMEIGQKLADAVGVPVRQGRFNAGLRRALGAFFPQKEVTRVRRFDQLDTVAHEIGHYISKKYLANPTMRSDKFRGQGRQPTALPKEAVLELNQMGKDLYGSRKPAGGYGEEGIAEWASFYVTEPATIAQKAPNFTAWMEQSVLQQEPMLRASLTQAREAFETYKKAPAAARFDAQIAVGERERFAFNFRDYMRFVWDDTYDIKAAVKELGGTRAPADDAAILARLSRGAWGEAEEWLRRGVRDIATADDRISAGIHETFAPIIRAGRAQELRRALDAASALERWDNGIDPGFTRADALEVIGLYKDDKEILAAAEATWAHSRALLQMRRDVGLITPEQFDRILAKNQRRVGFYRVFEPEETAAGRGGGAGGLGSSGIKRQTGSARRVVDPIEAIIRDTYVTAKKVRQHQAMKALVDQALATEGGGRWIEEVPAPMRPVTIPAQKLQQQLADLGLVYEGTDAKTGEKFTAPIGALGGHELDALLTAFQDARIPGAAERKDLVFPMLRGGELKWYAVKDRALYDAMVGLGPVEMRLWERILSGPKRLLQTGATTTLEFGFGNLSRDIVAQSVFSKASWRPPLWNHLEGLWHILQKDPVYQRYKLHGADQASMGGVDRGNLQLTSRRLFGYFRTLKQAWLDRGQAWQRATPTEKALDVHGDFWRVVTSPFEALRAVKEMSETMGRVGEFANVERQALKRGDRPVDASTEAALAARDVGIDFQQLGTATRQINHLNAFFGAHIRGMAQLGRELRERPGTVIPRMAATITVPSLVLYYLQRDDPVYRDMPAWKRDLFWLYVDRGDDRGEGWDGYGSGKVEHVWMFPKPFELGILFGTLPERAAEYFDQSNPEAGRAVVEALKRGATPPYIPTAAVPLIENYANRSTFRDRPIVPKSREGLVPSEQFAARTGETARAVGSAIDYSPAKIENLVRGYTGGAGMYVTAGTDALVRATREAAGMPPLGGPERPEEDALVDVPGLKRFLSRVPGEDAESVARLYREFDEAEQLRLTWRAMMREGRMAEARAHFTKHQRKIMAVATKEEAGQAGALRAAFQNMQKLQEVRRVVEQNPNNRRAVVDAMRRLGTIALAARGGANP